MSGIVPTEQCIKLFNDMKLHKQDLNFIIYKIKDYQEVVVEDYGKCPYTEFISKFKPGQCRYAVVEPPATKKLVFILWASPEAPVKDRMTYASSKSKLVEQLLGIHRNLQAYGPEDLSLESMANILK